MRTIALRQFRLKRTGEGVEELKDYFHTRRLTKEEIESRLDDYYEERRWNPETGVPLKEKLEEWGLWTLSFSPLLD